MLLTQRQAQVNQTQRTERGMTTLLNEHTAQAREFAHQYQNALLMGVEIANLNKRLGAVSDRINYLTLESQAPGFMRLFSSARSPELPVKGGYRKYLAVFVGLGFLLGLLAPLVIDYLDPRLQRLRSAEAIWHRPLFISSRSASTTLSRCRGLILRDLSRFARG